MPRVDASSAVRVDVVLSFWLTHINSDLIGALVVAGVLLLLVYRCCWCIVVAGALVVAGVMLLLVYCCCWCIVVAGVLLLLVYCYC